DRAITPSDGALILADFDHFKDVNDTYGHAAGDHALRVFAEAGSSTIRSTDLACRYGGEEFIFLIPGADAIRAELITAEISRRLAASRSMGGMVMPTVSYGISTYEAGTPSLQELIAAADTALYEAKLKGRNRAAH
ncbi:GGDEF domain-containing protein, partial [Escherichia coli]|uniref:GGDEF domain-containing protein n=1 Tax=Escherichia coli TaxID=562 RepID=UPI0032E52B88